MKASQIKISPKENEHWIINTVAVLEDDRAEDIVVLYMNEGVVPVKSILLCLN